MVRRVVVQCAQMAFLYLGFISMNFLSASSFPLSSPNGKQRFTTLEREKESLKFFREP
jgi:hypothetical protein